MPCSCQDIAFCTCPHLEHMVFSQNATYYPVSKLLRIDGQLFSMHSTRIGRHSLSMLVQALSTSFSYMLADGVINRLYLSFRYSTTRSNAGGLVVEIPSRFTCGVDYLHGGVIILVHVRRVQRAARQYLRRKWEERALAVMMATHARLGLGSSLESLHSDVLATISAMIRLK